MLGEVGVDAGMDHILEEAAPGHAVLQKKLDGPEQVWIVRCTELQRIARDQRADGTGIEMTIGRGWQGRAAKTFRHRRETVIDGSSKRIGLPC